MEKTISSVELEKSDKRQHSLAVSYCFHDTFKSKQGVFLVHVFNVSIKHTTNTAHENLGGFHKALTTQS